MSAAMGLVLHSELTVLWCTRGAGKLYFMNARVASGWVPLVLPCTTASKVSMHTEVKLLMTACLYVQENQ